MKIQNEKLRLLSFQMIFTLSKCSGTRKLQPELCGGDQLQSELGGEDQQHGFATFLLAKSLTVKAVSSRALVVEIIFSSRDARIWSITSRTRYGRLT